MKAANGVFVAVEWLGRARKGVEVWLMNIQKSCVSSLRDAYIFVGS